MTAAEFRLKEYMRDHFDFSSMKKAGIFPKEIKFNDYEGQAAVIRRHFSLASIYDYSFIGAGEYCHVSYVKPHAFQRFIEPIGEPLMKVESKTAKIIPFKTDNP